MLRLKHRFVCPENWTLRKMDQKYLGKISIVVLKKA